MNKKYHELLSAAINGFYEAKTSNKEKDKLYLKGLAEGMMKIIREADLLGRDDIDKIIDDAQKKYDVNAEKQKGYDLSDIDTPTYIRDGKDIGQYLL